MNIAAQTHGFYDNLSHHQEQVLQSLYSGAGIPRPTSNSHSQGKDLGNFFNSRMEAIMQQLSQYTDLSSLALHKTNLVDTTKAKKIHDFMQVTNSQMEANTLQSDFKSATSYLSIG